MTAIVVARLSRLSDALAEVLRDAEVLIAQSELGEPLAELRRIARELAELADRRTIHRRLAREGETFSDMLDAVRRELADRYIKEGKRSLTEVSELLGFSALSGFSRWYKRQNGKSAGRGRGRIRGAVPAS
jgi:AraC-like DNA-binding protein